MLLSIMQACCLPCYMICYKCTGQKVSSVGTPLADISQPVQKLVDFLATQDQVIQYQHHFSFFLFFFIKGQGLAQALCLGVWQQEPAQHQEPAI